MPTREQYERAIGRAQRAGDDEAVQSLIQDARGMVTGPGTMLEKFGAGMQDVVTGTKQAFGQAAPGEVAEHERTAKEADPSGWTRAAGSAVALAPLALALPASVPGAIAGGALSGLAMPTENPDVLQGKLINAGIGGATGGVLQKGAQMLPGALRAMTEQIAERTPLLPGVRQQIAERAFAGSVSDRPRAESALASYAPPSEIPNFRQTSAAASRDPALLAAERQLREAGGDLGQPLRDVTENQLQAVGQAWRSEFGGGKSAAAEAAREAFAQAVKPGLVFKRSLGRPGDFDPVQQVIQSAKQKAVGPELKAIEDVESMFYDALVKSANTGDITPLHGFRRFGINDALSKMYREGAPGSAVAARGTVQQVKSALDSELDRLLQGSNRFSNFMQGYRARSQAMSQAQAGEKMLAKLEARPPSAAGTPQYGGLLQDIRTQEAAGFQNPRFKTPNYTPPGEALLTATAREGEQALAPYSQTVGPRGSATAQNIAPAQRVLQRALDAQKRQQAVSAGEVGTGIGIGALIDPLTGILVPLAKRYGLDPVRARALNDTAQRMVKLYQDPQQALDAIIRSGLPAPQQSYLAQATQLLIAQSAGGAAAGAAQ